MPNFHFNNKNYNIPMDKISEYWTAIPYAKLTKGTVHSLFEERVEKAPNNTAFVYRNRTMSYREFNDSSNQLAHYLIQEYDIQADDRIVLFLDRSEYMYIGMMAALKSGAAYVPIDPYSPINRIAYLVSDIKPKVLLVSSIFKDTILLLKHEGLLDIKVLYIDDPVFVKKTEDTMSRNNPVTGIQPENLAYIIYTSGTTGKPKGAMIEHANLINLLNSAHKLYFENIKEFDSFQNFLGYYNYTFDGSVLEIFFPLVEGKTLYLLGESQRLDIPFLKKFIIQNKIDAAALPPVLLDKEYVYQTKLIWMGGEKPNQEMVNTYLENELYLFNVYGPTETTVSSNIRVYLPGDKSSNIGVLLFNYTGYVVDENMKLLPPGAIGELYIGGNGVGRGYFNNEELTQERFLINPFQSEEEKRHGFNGRIYKTGDLVRCSPDGSYDFLGRNDFQIKVRGFRIEIGEIEATLVAHPDIKHTVVVGKEHTNGMNFLVAYYTGVSPIDDDVLNEYLKKSLPEYMIPSVYIHLQSFVMNANGKIDLNVLPDVSFTDKEEYYAPENEFEKTLCKIYAEVLNLDSSKIGVNSDFFKLGGNSILAIKLVDRITKTFDKEIQIGDVFLYKTIRSIAEKIDNLNQGYEKILVPEITSEEDQVLSFAQERLWFIHQYESNKAAYNIPLAFKLKRDTNIDSVVKSIQSIVQRHQILRTQIHTSKNGSSYQFVCNDSLQLNEIKLSSIDDLDSVLSKAFGHLFTLSSEYPIYVEIYSVGEDRYMSVVFHHIAFDGWSANVFIREVLSYYRYHELIRLGQKGEAQAYLLPELTLQYKDFALWQRDHLKDEVLETQLNFWRNQLNGYEELNLSTDKIRPSQIDYTGNDLYFDIDKLVSNNLRHTAQELGISLYSLLISGFYVLLSAYSNQNDIVVGTPSANRNKNEISDLIGFFINTLAIRRSVEGEKNVVDFLTENGDFLSLVQNYQELPFEKLVEELHVKKDLCRHPVFQVMFGLQSFGHDNSIERNSLLEPLSIDAGSDYKIAKFDLTVMMDDSGESIIGSFNYQTSLFEADTMQSYIDTYKHILKQLSEICIDDNRNKKLSDLSFLETNAFNKIAFDWNVTNLARVSTDTLHASFEEQVIRTPDHIAIVCGNTRITYKELNKKANILASYIKTKYSIQPDDMIALCLDRSEFIPIAIIATMKAGAAYVPMDTAAPSERLNYMIADTKAKVVLTMSEYVDRLKNFDVSVGIEAIDTPLFIDNLRHEYPSTNVVTNTTTQNLAYIIYTSGTTGTPKGVMVEHQNVIRLFEALTKEYSFKDNDVWSLFHSYTFDFSVSEFWGSLLFGGKLIVPTYEETRSMNLFYNLCKSEGLTILNQTPTAFYQFVDSAIHIGTKLKSLRYVFFGGESLNTSQLKPWFDIYNEDKPYLINLYGITETTVFATHPAALKKSELDSVPSIGVTLEGYTSYVLDKYKRILPFGAIGELHLGGVGVTRGYLNNPELTKERFVENIYQTQDQKKDNFNGLLYKSGDLVKLTRNKDIEYIGRNDFQVKIRGFRIELEEISTRLSQIQGVKQSIVLVKDHSEDIKYLVAYYVSEYPLDSQQIRSYMEQYLPDYMIPSFFIHLIKFPLTLNGKLDRRALPEPSYNESRKYTAPRSKIEKTLCDIFADSLKIDASTISIDDDFFDLGGNSIVAIKLIHNINDGLDTKIRIVDLFMNRTVSKIVEFISQHTYKTIVELNESSSKTTMFMIHPGGGGCEAYIPLANRLSFYYKCYGIDSYNMYNENMIDDVHQLAKYYLESMDQIQTDAPYVLLGWSLGGSIALEIAAILEGRGMKDITVYLLDTVIQDNNKGLQAVLNTDDEIRKLIKKYEGIKFEIAKKLFAAENRLINQGISHKLISTKIVLFKAMLNNKERNESNVYEMDSILQNMDLLHVIKMPNTTHDDILDHEDDIYQRIINV